MSTVDRNTVVANLKKRRGVIRGSITRLGTRLRDMENNPESPGTMKHIKQTLEKLKACDDDFQTIHMELINNIGEEEAAGLEQDTLDRHDDTIEDFTIRLQELAEKVPHPAGSLDPCEPMTRKLASVKRELYDIESTLTALGDEHVDAPLLRQHLEQLFDYKAELASIHDELVKLSIADDHALMLLHAELKKLRFDCAYRASKLLDSHSTSTTKETVSDKSTKLPRLDVPTFDGDVLNWPQFWEQFDVSVHSRSKLSNAEKLLYLGQALQDGSAKHAIEGLSRSGDQYSDAVACLKERYDRPRQIYEAHVRALLEAPPLKDGTGKELRRLHDTLKQHLRALKTLGCSLDPAFITSMIQLKLDPTTSFEWMKISRDKVKDVPHHDEMLSFLDLTARASETSAPVRKQVSTHVAGRRSATSSRTVMAHATSAVAAITQCILCPPERHPLHGCPRFKSMSHEDKRSTLKRNHFCFNCLKGGHFLSQCDSSHRCRKCHRPHHTLLHIESHGSSGATPSFVVSSNGSQGNDTAVVSNAAIRLKSSSLLMTCKVLVIAPGGSAIEARALLDNASSASFVSERLAQILRLPRSHQDIQLSGITGVSPSTPSRSVANFQIAPVYCAGRNLDVSAVVVPRITRDLPVHPVPFDLSWTHLTKLNLADPSFGQPGKIDVLLGVDVFMDILRQGRRSGPSGSPIAVETEFGWVLGGNTDPVPRSDQVSVLVIACHTATLQDDDILRRFWEIEETPMSNLVLSPEERTVLKHFEENHSRTNDGRFIVPLPRKPEAKPIGESRSQAVRRFMSLERSLRHKNKFETVDAVMREYVDMGHAEIVPDQDLNKPSSRVFYLPMHVVHKDSSTTTKVRAVFDASAKSSSGMSLNDTLLVGPTVYPQLVDVLLRFRMHRIALTADVSKMYRAIELTTTDRDFHRFVWRSLPHETLCDYRMTRATFGVSASCFAANMAVKQNAVEMAHEYPLAARVVEESFYVDDGLTGADDPKTAIMLRQQLQDLFSCGGFTLRKWNSSESSVLEAIPPELCESKEVLSISGSDHAYVKTLGVKWDTTSDSFHVDVANLTPINSLTKRNLLSDIAKIFDVLGWFSPVIICMKILLQRTWEVRLDWDDLVPDDIRDTWHRWRLELKILSDHPVPRCYFPTNVHVVTTELHGFSDASEDAYAGVVYLRMIDSSGSVHISLVMSKTKVSPIKRLSIPRLELCGAVVVTRLLQRVKDVLQVPLSNVHAWTDSTIVLSWLSGNPRRFKTFVGNRVSEIMDAVPPEHWKHVVSTDNPADCASRGLFPLELSKHELWWNGPPWLLLDQSYWPRTKVSAPESPLEEREICLTTTADQVQPLVQIDRFSSFTRLQRVTAWVMRFVSRCRTPVSEMLETSKPVCLTVAELTKARQYWIKRIQLEHFQEVVAALESGNCLPRHSNLSSLLPFVDSDGILRVGGRNRNSKLPYFGKHPAILHGKHHLTRLIIRSEHLRLLHAGPTLVYSSLVRRFHIVGTKRVVRSVVRHCLVCRRHSVKPEPQVVGQLPAERVTPGNVFENVGVDYAGPLQIKYGHVRKPVLVKAYICIFVSLSVKAIHLEAVSDLTAEAFIGTLRRFIARRGCPRLIMSDNGTNFVGADRQIQEFYRFLAQQEVRHAVVDTCASNGIEWRFIPERSPHFGGLWEAAVKSVKIHLRRIVGTVNLTFEELTTVLAQIEACLNSRPLIPVDTIDEDLIEVLTPGHFLVGRPLCAMPDPQSSYRPVSILRRWQLCQNLVRHFWKRWSADYLASLNKFNKWKYPTRNITVGDVVILREDSMIPTRWPLARVLEVHRGDDGMVRVAIVKTAQSTFKRPVVKLAVLVPAEQN